MSDDPRRLAVQALVRIDRDGAYANIVVPNLLEESDLDGRDRGFVTELVYGTTRRRRALDHLIEPFLTRDPPPAARAALRIGTYQLFELGTPPHAAVSATVSATPKRFRGLVNAVLRRVAGRVDKGIEWPDDATELSYPDWIVDRLRADLGRADADAALRTMNGRAVVHRRADGYVQDRSSQLVTESMPAGDGDLVADLCAAPGGKATALAGRGARVVAIELNPGRAARLVENRRTLGLDDLMTVIADGTRPPLPDRSVDLVLIDAPCTGLGALRRRPDARWHVKEGDIDRLVALQARLIEAGSELVVEGGTVAYSVCTLTTAETRGVAERVELDGFEPVPVGPPWRAHGTGGLLLPDDDTDGMALFCWRRSG